jgi:hypothetical protein
MLHINGLTTRSKTISVKLKEKWKKLFGRIGKLMVNTYTVPVLKKVNVLEHLTLASTEYTLLMMSVNNSL